MHVELEESLVWYKRKSINKIEYKAVCIYFLSYLHGIN